MNHYRIKNKPKNTKFKLRNMKLNLFKKFFLKKFINKFPFRVNHLKRSKKKFYGKRFRRSKKFFERFSERFVDEFLETLPKKEPKRQKALRELFFETIYFRRRRRRRKITRKRLFFKPNFSKSSFFYNRKYLYNQNLLIDANNLYKPYHPKSVVSDELNSIFNPLITSYNGVRVTHLNSAFYLNYYDTSRNLFKRLIKSLRKRKPFRYLEFLTYFLSKKYSPVIVNFNPIKLTLQRRSKSSTVFERNKLLHLSSWLPNFYIHSFYSIGGYVSLVLDQSKKINVPKLFAYSYNKLIIKRFRVNPFFNKDSSFLSINSLHRKNFILLTNGFLLLGLNYIRFSTKYFYRKSRVKSKIYKNQLSFFYKNDLKRIYLRRPGFIKALSYFSKSRFLRKKYARPTTYDAKISRISADVEYKNPFLVNQFLNRSIAKYRSKNFFLDHNFKLSNFRVNSIRRIRFKPGYQRI
jgi:hypothetical protein